MEQPITTNPDPSRTHRWERQIISELSRYGVDVTLLMPDELETLMVLRERADAAYGAYLDAEDAARKALRQKEYAQADYDRCLQYMISSLQFTLPIPRNARKSQTEDAR